MRRTYRRITTALAVLVLAAATLGPTVQAAPKRKSGLRVGRNTRLNTEKAPVRARDIPGLAVNPRNPQHIVEVDQEYRYQHCTFHVTFDGGKTWKGGNLRGPKGFDPDPDTAGPRPLCVPLDSGGYGKMNASVVFGSGDNVYTTFSSGGEDNGRRNVDTGRAQTGDSVLVARSTNGGRSFKRAVVAIQGDRGPAGQGVSYIRPEIGVDPPGRGADRVYVSAWLLDRTNPASLAQRVVSATSKDGGASFTGPVAVSPPNATTVSREQSQPVVGDNGEVFIAYRERLGSGQAARNFLKLAKSTDQGTTWVPVATSEERVVSFGGLQPRMAVNSSGRRLYVAYMAEPFGDFDVFVRSSSDGGVTWSERVRVNDDDQGNKVLQTVPWISVGPRERLDVVWFDQRHAYPGALSQSSHSGASIPLEDVFFAFSSDRGKTFSKNRRLTDRTRNLDIGVRDETNFGPFWGPVAVPLGRNRVLAAWSDSRLGNVYTDTQDIFTAKINLKPTGRAPVSRVSSRDAVGKSVALSRLAYPGGGEDNSNLPVSRVVVVNKSDRQGALAGGVLARLDLGSVLLSDRSRLTRKAKREVARIDPVGAYLVGEESKLSEGVADDLRKRGIAEDQIVRVAGSGNADTARLIAQAMDTRSDADRLANKPAFSAAFIVNQKSPTGSAVAAEAAALRLPVLFVRKDAVPQPTKEALEELDIDKTLIVGGKRIIGADVASQFPSPTRLGGRNVYAVSKSVVRDSLQRGAPTNLIPHNIFYVADGRRPLDGAIFGAAVARLGGQLLLTPRANVGAARRAIDNLGLGARLDRIVVLGRKR